MLAPAILLFEIYPKTYVNLREIASIERDLNDATIYLSNGRTYCVSLGILELIIKEMTVISPREPGKRPSAIG